MTIRKPKIILIREVAGEDVDVLLDGSDSELWVGGLTANRVANAEYVHAEGENVKLCRVCHMVSLDGLHPECAKEVALG